MVSYAGWISAFMALPRASVPPLDTIVEYRT
jgi:hypothetical protein